MLVKKVDNGLTWGTTQDSALVTYLEESEESKYRQVWEHLQYHPESAAEEVNRLVREENHACWVPKRRLDKNQYCF